MRVVRFVLVFYSFLFSPSVIAIPEIPEIPGFPEISSSGNRYHVNNISGNDNLLENDGSINSPWASFRFSVGQLLPGDKLTIHGTGMPYSMEWTALVRADDDTRWIQIIGRDGPDGERATFTGRLSFGNTTGGSAKYILLRNVFFQGAGGSNINIVIYSDSHHLAFDNVEIDCEKNTENERAIWTNSGVHHVWFKDVYVHQCGYSRNVSYDSPISTFPTDCGGICIKAADIDEIVFLNVTAAENIGDGISGSKHSSGNYYFKRTISERNTGDGFDLGGKRVVILDSISRDNCCHQGTGFKFWSKETWLVSSVSYQNRYVGVQVKPVHNDLNKAYILNNTIAVNSVGQFGGQIATERNLPPPDGSLDLYIYNNIIHALNTSAIVILNSNNQLIKEEGNNYYFSEYDDSLDREPHWAYVDAIHYRDGMMKVGKRYSFTDVADGGRWGDGKKTGINNIGEIAAPGKPDPGFRNLDSGDLHLVEGSLAIDAGIDIGLGSDLEDRVVPNGSAPDIGAFEFGN